MKPARLRPWLALIAVSLAIHTAGLVAIAHRFGGIDAFAFRSSDSGEYHELARSLAEAGRYERSGRPDTWRVPVYPAFLAAAIRGVGDDAARLVLIQHGVAVLGLLLCYAAGRIVIGARRAFVAALLWGCDPFRVYYSSWLLAETLFTAIVLLGVLAWVRTARRGSAATAAGVGGLVGLAILTRPIGVFLPLLAIGGMLVVGRTWRRRWRNAALCAATTGLVVAPWLLRTHHVTGRWALSWQSGVSLAYYKAVEVRLWERGLAAGRFDSAVVRSFVDEVDAELAAEWERQHGPLTDAERAELRGSQLMYGHIGRLNPVDVSRALWRVGGRVLLADPPATIACFAVRGVSMATFPMALGLRPPANPDSAPFTGVLGAGRPMLARTLAIVVGLPFAVLAIAAIVRAAMALRRRAPWAAWFAVVVAIGFAVMTVPFEDPRFREPMVPLLLLAVLAPLGARKADASRHDALAEGQP